MPQGRDRHISCRPADGAFLLHRTCFRAGSRCYLFGINVIVCVPYSNIKTKGRWLVACGIIRCEKNFTSRGIPSRGGLKYPIGIHPGECAGNRHLAVLILHGGIKNSVVTQAIAAGIQVHRDSIRPCGDLRRGRLHRQLLYRTRYRGTFAIVEIRACNGRIEVVYAHGQVTGGMIRRFIDRTGYTTCAHQFTIFSVRITLEPLKQIVITFPVERNSKKCFRPVSVFDRLISVPINFRLTDPQRIEGLIVGKIDYGIPCDLLTAPLGFRIPAAKTAALLGRHRQLAVGAAVNHDFARWINLSIASIKSHGKLLCSPARIKRVVCRFGDGRGVIHLGAAGFRRIPAGKIIPRPGGRGKSAVGISVGRRLACRRHRTAISIKGYRGFLAGPVRVERVGTEGGDLSRSGHPCAAGFCRIPAVKGVVSPGRRGQRSIGTAVSHGLGGCADRAAIGVKSHLLYGGHITECYIKRHI